MSQGLLTAVAVWLFSSLCSCAVYAQDAPPQQPASIDLRRKATGLPAGAEQGKADLRAKVRNATVDWDEVTGAPKMVTSDAFLTGPNGEGRGVTAETARKLDIGDPLRPVKAFLDEHRKLFGHGSEALAVAEVQRDHTDSHNGLRTIVWQQKLDGIPVFEAVLKAHITARRELVNIGSGWVRDAAMAADAGTPNHARLRQALPITAARALAIAGQSVGSPVDAASVTQSSEGEPANQRQTFKGPHLSDATAEMVWFPLRGDRLRLCWQAVFSSDAGGGMFLTLIDVETGEILLRRSLTADFTDATYRVFTSDSPRPFSPGLSTPGTFQAPEVARTLVTTPALNTTASPNGWIDDGVNETRGNNVDAHTDTDGNNIADTPRPQGSPNRVFDFPIDFTQAPSAYKDAAVTQLFYWCNFIHDRLYELGFTESAGNFQNNNFGRGGVGNDAVQADAQDGSGTDNANFSTPPDGSPGRMQMFLWTGPTPDVDGDFDAEVVLHEYTHGLTNRLVGGGVGISAPITAGMGEGWSDFYGMTLLAEASDDVNGVYARGAYSRTLAGGTFNQNYYFGGRRYPYCTDLAKNPLTLKDIDPAQASAHAGVPRSPIVGTTANEVHNMGEVWAMTLWEIRANLVTKLGFAIGNQLTLQLVTDGLKLSPANPNFLQARDAILQAELVLTGGANRGELWTAFAKRGMGRSATAPVSSTSSGVVEAFDLPDDLSVSPMSLFTSVAPLGGSGSPSVRTYTLANTGASTLNWSASKTQSWLTLSASSGTLAAGASATLTATINSGVAVLPAGTYSDSVTFQNLTSGISQTRGVVLSVTAFPIYSFPLTSDPGWSRTGEWAFGHPTGGGGASHGSHDPGNGFTGTNVFGVNLTGDYSSTVGGPYYVTTTAINLSSYTATQLRFERWLNSDYQPYASATVEVSNNGVTWTQIWNNAGTTVADSAWTRVTYDISAIADKQATVYVRWGYSVGSGAFLYSGWNIDDVEILGSPAADLTVTLPASASEGDGPLIGTITATPAPIGALTVSLSSILPSRLTVPASVTIPAGSMSANFAATVIDDSLLNGTAIVSVIPAAPGYSVHAANIEVVDNESAVLSVTLPASTTEGVGTVVGNVTVSAAPSSDITVQLVSNKPGDALPPTSVKVNAGQTTATFPLTIVDDPRIDGTQSVVITATVPNWTAGTATIDVADNENTNLTLTAPARVREGDVGKSGMISIAGTLSGDLLVTLGSDDTTEISLPVTVTIVAGQTSAAVPFTVVDDTLTDGSQPVTLTASASGFGGAQAAVTVDDNDADHFSISPIASPQTRGVAFAATITAQDANGATIATFGGSPSLSASAGGSAVPVTPANVSAFVNGVATVNVALGAFATNAVLTVSDGAGHTGASNPFDVGTSSVDHFIWATVPSPQTMDAPFAATISAVDAGNNVVTNYNGTANLSMLTPVAAPPIGTGILQSSYVFYGFNAKARTTSLYLASEMAGPSQLTSLSVNVASPNAQAFNNFTIRLKHTLAASFATASWDSTGWTTVYQSSVTPATTGWLKFTFSTPFDYDGTSNLLVDLSFNNTTANGQAAYITSTSTTPARSEYSSSSTIDPLTWAGTTGATPFITGSLPNLQFTVERPLSVRPSTATFSSGIASSGVSVPFTAASVRLSAADTAGHRGSSNSFTVNVPAIPSGGGALVFADDFESGSLGPQWAVSGTSTYRTQVTTANLPHGGARHLTMDSSVDGTLARNEATLTVNLVGRSGVALTFWAKMFNDEPNGPPTSPFTGGADFDGVAISTDGTTWYEVQSLRSPTISASWAKFTVDLDAAIAAHGLSYTPNFKIRFNQYDDYSISTDGIAVDDISLTAIPLNAITVTLPAQATEGSGQLAGNVTLPSTATSDTVVALNSNSPAKISVPASVTVAAGQTSAAFNATVLDDTLLDGAKAVFIAASAAGLNSGSTSVQVLDNDTSTLSLAIPTTVAENAGVIQGTISLASAALGNLTVSLSSSDLTAAQVPATISFSPGQISATFPITPVDDAKIDGTQPTTIVASIPGWPSASAVLQVADNETRTLSISGIYSVAEGTSQAGQVYLSGSLSTDLTVSLSSSNPTQFTVPASVTILAGQTSASFTAVAVDDTAMDGTQTATVTASAATFTAATTTVSVYDNDVHHFTISTIGSPQATGVPFSVTIFARDVNNASIDSFNGTVTLAGSGPGGAVPVSPAVGGPFSSGSWTGNVTCATSVTGLKISATSGSATGLSNAFDVQMSPAISVSPGGLLVSLPIGGSTTRTVTVGNTGGGSLAWSVATASGDAGELTALPSGALEARVSVPLDRIPARADAEHTLGGTLGIEVPSDALSSLTLSAALSNLNANFGLVRSAIPNRYPFTEGVTGSSITDGGADLYDTGNILGTNLGTPIAYSDGVLATSALLGSGGQYFTRKYDGFWVFAANVTGLTYFEITGNLGADGAGSTDSTVLSVTRGGITYRGFVKRVYNSGDPSVNHLIIVADNGSVTQTASSDTNDDSHRISGLGAVSRIYQVLYAGSSGAYIDNTSTLAIMNAFLDAISVPDWTSAAPSSGSVAAGGSQSCLFTFNAANLAPGTYTRNLLFTSNSPSTPQVSIPVTLTVGGGLSVSPSSALAAAGPRGGPFTPASQNYTLSNSGSQAVSWTATKAASWLNLSATSGTLNPGSNFTVTATFNANTLAAGTYSDAIIFSGGNGTITVPVTLGVAGVGALSVSPGSNWTAAGPPGGPFTPGAQNFTVMNTGDAPLIWSAAKSASWLGLSSSGGTLAAGASITITATISAGALSAGNYNDSITFTNTSSGLGNTSRTVALAVAVPAPALTAEPAFTPATTNTIFWNSIGIADSYEAQCATDAAFTSPISSGPIVATSYTFTGLVDNTRYFYRVRARKAGNAQPGSWSQTTQADFGSDALSGVSATALPDSIILTPSTTGLQTLTEDFNESGTAWTSTMFPDATAGTFTRGVLAGGPNTTPPLPVNVAGDSCARVPGSQFVTSYFALRADTVANRFSDGSIDGYFIPESRATLSHNGMLLRCSRGAGGVNGYAAVVIFYADGTAKADFARVVNGSYATTTGWFYSNTTAFTVGSQENVHARFSVNGSTLSLSLWRVAVSGGNVVESPIAFFGGTNTLTATDSTYSAAGLPGLVAFLNSTVPALFDDVSITQPGGGGYPASGTITSSLIAPSPWQGWGTLQYARDVSPAGTALTVDILDSVGSLLAGNVASGTDLSTISAVAANPLIKLRANLSTTNSANTPRLDDWALNYTAVPAQTYVSTWSATESSTQFNAPPSMTAIPNQGIVEDGTTIALPFTIGDDTTALAALSVTVQSSDETLLPLARIQLGGFAASRSITIFPAPNRSGSAVVTVRVTDGGGKFVEQVIPVVVAPVNDAPSFLKGSDPTVLEDSGPQLAVAWATGISAGPADETIQALDFIVASDNPSLFAAGPSLAANGTLSFTPAVGASGSATVTVRLHDSGGVANGGNDTSAVQSFSINVIGVNDAPSFTKGANQALKENAGPVSVPGWANGISAGAADESSQVLNFIVATDQPALFVSLPAVAPDGTLAFTMAPGANGTARVTVRLHDDGGTANNGSDTSLPQTFEITIAAVNDAPSFVKGSDQTVLEDADAKSVTGWAKQVSAGPPDETGQVLDFIVTNDNPVLFSAPPEIGADGTLKYAVAANANGVARVSVRLHDDGGTANGGRDTSDAQTFTITVTPVNDAPTLDALTDLEINEDAPEQVIALSGIGTGAPDEVQTLTITASSSKPGVIPNPTVEYASPDATATLKLRPIADRVGDAIITVRIDDGGAEFGSTTRAFAVHVGPVNDAPAFVGGSNLTVLEDSGVQTVPGWATQLSAGGEDEAGQLLDFIVTTGNPALFSAGPSVTADGTLSFTPAPDANGIALVTVRLHDNGGTAGGGSDTSAVQTFTIDVTPVNDTPAFARGPDFETPRDAGPQSVEHWATAIVAGPPDEAAQPLTFVATVDDASLFTAPPAISADGTLTYTPAPQASGRATVTVRLKDDGGTANGGFDTSAAQTFTIAVTAFAEEVGTYDGLITPAPGVAVHADHYGIIRVAFNKRGLVTGKVTLAGSSTAFKGKLDYAGGAHFGATQASSLPLRRGGKAPLSLSFKVDVADGSDTLTGTIADETGAFAIFIADRAVFTAAANPVPPMRKVPGELLGAYTILISPRAASEESTQTAALPAGHGSGTLKINARGEVRVAARLADGTTLSSANHLSKAQHFPLYHGTLQGDALSCSVSFRDIAEVSDLDGVATWFRAPRKRGLYAAGWPDGAAVDFVGAHYHRVPGGPVLSLAAGGSSRLREIGGGIDPADPPMAVIIGDSNRITVVPPNRERLALQIHPATGLFSGKFTHPISGKPASIHGAILQKQNLGTGAFRTSDAAGMVLLEP